MKELNNYELKKIRGKYNFNERKSKIDFRTNELIKSGINYKKFIKVHNRLIQHDLKNISGDGCYLLFYLICHAFQREYIETTIAMIKNNINMSKEKINNALKFLHINNLINIKGFKNSSKDIGINDVLQIVIIYDNETFYDATLDNTIGIGYKAIPIDYIKYSIVHLKPMEFSILLCLILRFRYYIPIISENKKGEILYTYQCAEYAYPKLDTISEYLGSTRKTIKKYIINLANKGFITYEPNGQDLIKKYNSKTGEYDTVNPNYKYRIYLLQRVEYMYYNYYILPDLYKDDNKQNDRDYILKLIKKKGFENVAESVHNTQILEKDYIRYFYNSQIQDLEKIIKNKDDNTYNNLDKRLIDNFKNQNVIEPTKRRNKE